MTDRALYRISCKCLLRSASVVNLSTWKFLGKTTKYGSVNSFRLRTPAACARSLVVTATSSCLASSCASRAGVMPDQRRIWCDVPDNALIMTGPIVAAKESTHPSRTTTRFARVTFLTLSTIWSAPCSRTMACSKRRWPAAVGLAGRVVRSSSVVSSKVSSALMRCDTPACEMFNLSAASDIEPASTTATQLLSRSQSGKRSVALSFMVGIRVAL
ncbi:hypothetical protein D3C81_842650 [compost metagenome]